MASWHSEEIAEMQDTIEYHKDRLKWYQSKFKGESIPLDEKSVKNHIKIKFNIMKTGLKKFKMTLLILKQMLRKILLAQSLII